MTPTISSLLSRVRAASGPDRELDARIDAALFGGRAARDFTGEDPASRLRFSYAAHVVFDHVDPMTNGGHVLSSMVRFTPPITASIDASVALVERVLPGCDWKISTLRHRKGFGADLYPSAADAVARADAATAPLAILAALLSALEQKESADDPRT